MNNTEHKLNPDTQAILLLCGHFGKKTTGEIKPLTPSEYTWMAQWLQELDNVDEETRSVVVGVLKLAVNSSKAKKLLIDVGTA